MDCVVTRGVVVPTSPPRSTPVTSSPALSLVESISECFKALICPLGLEELRCVLRYEQTNLAALIVAVRTNQILLDSGMR